MKTSYSLNLITVKSALYPKCWTVHDILWHHHIAWQPPSNGLKLSIFSTIWKHPVVLVSHLRKISSIAIKPDLYMPSNHLATAYINPRLTYKTSFFSFFTSINVNTSNISMLTLQKGSRTTLTWASTSLDETHTQTRSTNCNFMGTQQEEKTKITRIQNFTGWSKRFELLIFLQSNFKTIKNPNWTVALKET